MTWAVRHFQLFRVGPKGEWTLAYTHVEQEGLIGKAKGQRILGPVRRCVFQWQQEHDDAPTDAQQPTRSNRGPALRLTFGSSSHVLAAVEPTSAVCELTSWVEALKQLGAQTVDLARMKDEVFTASGHSAGQAMLKLVGPMGERMLAQQVDVVKAMVIDGCQQPFMPECLRHVAKGVGRITADKLAFLLTDYVKRRLLEGVKSRRRRRLFHWPPSPPLPALFVSQEGEWCSFRPCEWCGRMLEYSRASFLYVVKPADANIFKLLQPNPAWKLRRHKEAAWLVAEEQDHVRMGQVMAYKRASGRWIVCRRLAQTLIGTPALVLFALCVAVFYVPEVRDGDREYIQVFCAAFGVLGVLLFGVYNPRYPWAWVYYLGKYSPALTVPIFALQFCCQDNADEHTLTRFILQFKGLQFFTTGIVSAFVLSFHYFSCLTELDMTGSSHVCIDGAPGMDNLFPVLVACDLVRLCFVFAAFYKLRSAFGGPRAIAALDALRLDVADGSLDGKVTLKVLQQDDRGFWALPNRRAKVEKRKASWRRCFGAQRGQDLASGQVMDGLFKWELCSSLFVLSYWAAFALYKLRALTERGDGPEDDETWQENTWILWTAAYYLRFCCALMAFPYLLLLLPIVGDVLRRDVPTGYDHHGMLVPQLTAIEIEHRWLIERERMKGPENDAVNEEDLYKRAVVHKASRFNEILAKVSGTWHERSPKPAEQAAAARIQRHRRHTADARGQQPAAKPPRAASML